MASIFAASVRFFASRSAVYALPFSAAAMSRSSSTTSIPACAATIATPAPISPAPSIAIFFAGIGATFFGRRAPFSAACFETNRVRIMLPACGSATTLAKYLLSTRSAVSIGSCEPSYTADSRAIGAFILWLVAFAVIAVPAMKVWAKPGLNAPTPPGNLNPFSSHGATALGLAATHALARATT